MKFASSILANARMASALGCESCHATVCDSAVFGGSRLNLCPRDQAVLDRQENTKSLSGCMALAAPRNLGEVLGRIERPTSQIPRKSEPNLSNETRNRHFRSFCPVRPPLPS